VLRPLLQNWFNYDALGVIRGKYRFQWQGVRIGERAIRKVLGEQLGVLKQDGVDCIGNYPVMMGEIGVPFDLDGRKAYETGNYSNQIRALDASMNACDGENAMSRTLWTYCPDNTHLEGDQWDGEDLSVWSKDDREATQNPVKSLTSRKKDESQISLLPEKNEGKSVSVSVISSPNRSPDGSLSISGLEDPPSLLDLNDGARALPAFCRPHPVAVVGRIKFFEFDIRSSVFTLEVNVRAGEVLNTTLPTEIYLPLVHYASRPESVTYTARNAKSDKKLHSALNFDVFGHKDSNSLFACHHLFKNPETYSDSLALEVEVSSGRFEVEGQMLKWYYSAPKGGIATEYSELYGKPHLVFRMLGSLVRFFPNRGPDIQADAA